MSLRNHLQHQQERMQIMEALLKQEQLLLGEGKVDGAALEAVAKEKQSLFAELEQSELKRRNAQEKLGYPLNREGSEQAAADSNCSELWQDLILTTENVAHLNALNGDLIQHRLQHNQQMLNILRDASGASLYGPDGQSKKSIPRVSSKA
ncbi:flagellar biosynthesis/type III secretory pathway chaperone [Idiomarina sp. A28L]|uniref:flagella synthesis protein FlgN n=1 Tax=Idiomarina sp. A28L TaxID=1036674 RepID=UPI0002138C77|nr:flagellar protein FlgN [Idiomarina sp. A28L]EGN76003.1 flagellar biosynthesis/type III secretory pathway chaperone [Idiomarina sp. A28L]